MDLIEKIDAPLENDSLNIDVLLEVLDHDNFQEVSPTEIYLSTRRDHPMSGYNDSFEFLDVEITLKEVDGKFIVEEKSKRGHGELGKYLARQIEEGDMDFPDKDDYDDFDPDYSEENDSSETFDTIEQAIEEINNAVDFEG